MKELKDSLNHWKLLTSLLISLFFYSCATNYKSIDESITEHDHQLTTLIKAKPFSFFPAKGQISSHFGFRKDPYSKLRKMHKGLDIRVPVGASIVAPASGKVMFVGERNGFGLVIEILHDNQLTTRYAHLDKFLVKQPQKVQQGQIIGLSGNSGNATGPHLHYEILHKGEQIDPYVYTKTGEIVYESGKELK